MGFTMNRRKPDLDALDWRKDEGLLRKQRQLANLSTAITAIERQLREDEERLAEIGPNLDALLDVLDGGDAGLALTAQRQAINAQREALAERCKANRGILREQDALRRRLEEAVSAAESRARAERAEKVEAATRATTEALAQKLREAAPLSEELRRLNRIAGIPAGWPRWWSELDLHSGSPLDSFLRAAEAFGCRIEPIADEGDPVLAEAGKRHNRRQRRRAEIAEKADAIRADEGNAEAERFLATASAEV